MAGFSEDDIKYIQAIQDYMGYRLKGLPEFFYKTKDLLPEDVGQLCPIDVKKLYILRRLI